MNLITKVVFKARYQHTAQRKRSRQIVQKPHQFYSLKQQRRPQTFLYLLHSILALILLLSQHIQQSQLLHDLKELSEPHRAIKDTCLSPGAASPSLEEGVG